MVRKLIKYDFQSYLRLLLPVQLILIGIAFVNRIVQLFENTDSGVYTTIFVSSLVLYIVAIIVLILMTVIISIMRFYQGMYSNEGYLSHTLPVTPAQHITAKLLTSLLFYFGTLLSVFASFIVITLGEVNIEVFKAFGYLVKQYFTQLGFQGAVFILEAVLTLFALRITTFLLYYFCISVGQLVSRKKILLAFGVYFGLYVISQIIGTISIIIFTMSPIWLENIMDWLTEHPYPAIHIYLCGMLVGEAVLGTFYFLFTKYIMGKKLNLT